MKSFRWIQPKTLFWIVLIFLITLKTHRTYMGQGDEPHYIVVSESLLLDHDLDLTNNYRSPRLRDFNSYHVVWSKDGKLYPYHSVGLSILGIPVLAVVHLIEKVAPAPKPENQRLTSWIRTKNTFSFSMMILAGFVCVWLYKLLLLFIPNQKMAWVTALAVSLSPPMLSYGFLFFAELPTVFLLLVCLTNYFKKKPLGFWDSVCIGFLPWLHMRNYLVAVLLLALFLIQKKQFRYAAISGLMWAGVLVLNFSIWKGPTAELMPIQLRHLPINMPAFFFDRAFGLFIFAPLYLFAACGLAMLYEQKQKQAKTIFYLLISQAAPLTAFPVWWGGWSPGPRYLTPLIPFFAIGVAIFFSEAWRMPKGKILVKSLITVTFVLAVLYWQAPRLLWNHEDGVNDFLMAWFGPVGRLAHSVLPNFFDPFPKPQLMTLLPLTITAFVNGFFYFNYRREIDREKAAMIAGDDIGLSSR